jgi:hypothetical protein
MFVNYNWPLQDYKTYVSQARGLGGLLAAGLNAPSNVNSANYLKRQEVMSVLKGELDYADSSLNSTETVLNADGNTKWADTTSPRPIEAVATATHTPTVRLVGSEAGQPVEELAPIKTGDHLEHLKRHKRHHRGGL